MTCSTRVGLGIESGLKSIFAGLGLGLELKGLGLGLGKICNPCPLSIFTVHICTSF